MMNWNEKGIFNEKGMQDKIIKNIKNLFKLEKPNQAIKDRIIKDIRSLFEHEEEDCHKPVRERNFWSNIYIEHESIKISFWAYSLIMNSITRSLNVNASIAKKKRKIENKILSIKLNIWLTHAKSHFQSKHSKTSC